MDEAVQTLTLETTVTEYVRVITPTELANLLGLPGEIVGIDPAADGDIGIKYRVSDDIRQVNSDPFWYRDVVHYTSDGRAITLREMDENHLRNAWNKYGYDHYELELQFRQAL